MERIFNDEEWRKLKRLSGLADESRIDIEEVVRFLKKKPSLKHPLASEFQEVRANIRNAIKVLDDAIPAIKALLQRGAGSVFSPLIIGPDNDAVAVSSKEKVRELHDLMLDATRDLKYSERRLPYARSGRHKSHLTEALAMLNEIVFDATGRPLNQKKQNPKGIDPSKFALQVCQKADPKLEIDTILNQIKRLQSRRSQAKR